VGAVLALAMHAASPPPAAHPEARARLDASVDSLMAHVVTQCRVEGAATATALEPEEEPGRAEARAARVVALGCLRACLKSGRPHAVLPYATALLPVALASAACVRRYIYIYIDVDR